MKHDNPFAKLGALDQKLYQDTTPKPLVQEVKGVQEKVAQAKSQHAGKPANQHARVPACQSTSKPESQQPGKPDLWKSSNPATWQDHSP